MSGLGIGRFLVLGHKLWGLGVLGSGFRGLGIQLRHVVAMFFLPEEFMHHLDA